MIGSFLKKKKKKLRIRRIGRKRNSWMQGSKKSLFLYKSTPDYTDPSGSSFLGALCWTCHLHLSTRVTNSWCLPGTCLVLALKVPCPGKSSVWVTPGRLPTLISTEPWITLALCVCVFATRPWASWRYRKWHGCSGPRGIFGRECWIHSMSLSQILPLLICFLDAGCDL